MEKNKSNPAEVIMDNTSFQYFTPEGSGLTVTMIVDDNYDALFYTFRIEIRELFPPHGKFGQ